MFAESAGAFIDGLRLLRERKHESTEAIRNKRNAFELVIEAVIATKAHLYDTKVLEQPSRAMERILSDKWNRASMAIHDYDYQLFEGAHIKALGWADPREWSKAKEKEHLIMLDNILEQSEWHLEQLR